MSWWQKKVLRYALTRIGILDDEAIQLDNLDIALGRRNVVELRNVGLKKDRISALIDLPPNVSIQEAQVRLLRLSVPADIYKSAITAEADGIELAVNIQEVATPQADPSENRNFHHPQHSTSRSHGVREQDGGHIPSTQEMARSFLLEGSPNERRQLEDALAKESNDMTESFRSESTENEDVGTGAAVGLPGFLAGFLQAIVDRLQVSIKNIELTLFYAPEVCLRDAPMIRITIKEVAVGSVSDSLDLELNGKRPIEVNSVSVDLPGQDQDFPGVKRANDAKPDVPVIVSSTENDAQQQPSLVQRSTTPVAAEQSSFPDITLDDQTQHESSDLHASSYSRDDVGRPSDEVEASDRDYGIKAGDDNISWVSRKSSQSTEDERLWDETSADDDLRQSIAFEATGLPAYSTRANRPLISRQRRSVSPYERHLHNTSSWPLSPEPKNRSWPVPSTNSWPFLSPQQRSASHMPRVIRPTSHPESPVASESNLERHAADDSDQRLRENAKTITAEESSDEDEPSMYFSMTSNTSNNFHENREDAYHGDAYPSHVIHSSEPDITPAMPNISVTYESRLDNSTPRPTTPHKSSDESKAPLATHPPVHNSVLAIDRIIVYVPSSASFNTIHESLEQKSTSTHIPGSFASSYDIGSMSPSTATTQTSDSSHFSVYPVRDPDLPPSQREIVARIGHVKVQLHARACKTLIMLSTAFTHLSRQDSQSKTGSNSAFEASSTNSLTGLSLRLEELRVDMTDYLEVDYLLRREPALPVISLVVADASFSSRLERQEVNVGNVSLYLAGTEMLAVKRSSHSALMLGTKDSPAIHLSMNTTQSTLDGRQVKEVHCEAMPINVFVDLQTIDEILPFCGAFFELQDLISHSSKRNSPKNAPLQHSKGVRFEDVASETPAKDDELKINIRINGLHFMVAGTAARVGLDTTTIKAVYRESGAKATVEHISITGPHNNFGAVDPPIQITLNTIRVDYSMAPRDSDLERLLLLLTPSKDKYDNDDDILLETLLRQRRQGSVGRVLVGQVYMKCTDLHVIPLLTELSDDMAKFAAVAKYLPEDDRPGLLSLLKIDQLKAQIHINENLGTLELTTENLDLAHVGLPAMLAFAVSQIRVRQVGKSDIIRPLISTGTGEMLPMLMARMLGDDEEPTIKVKIYNVCVEYSVPLVMALEDLNFDGEDEDILATLTHSIADLSLLKVEPRMKGSQKPKAQVTSTTKLVLLMRDSAVGLSPHKLPSKAVLILSDARCTTPIPAEGNFTIETELKKVSLWLVDQRDAEAVETGLRIPNNTATSPRVAMHLSQNGYVPVASILSARIVVVFTAEDEANASNSVEVKVENELMLLETCADSTQTLIATLGDLAPPSAPSKQPQYHMDPMTINDMLASFSGDAFPQSMDDQVSRDILFDVGDSPVDENEDPDDVFLSEAITRSDLDLDVSEPSSSMYGSSRPDFMGERLGEDDPDNWPATAASLLEEDPFVMTVFEEDAPLTSQDLFRDLQKQCRTVRNQADKQLDVVEHDNPLDRRSGTEALAPYKLPLAACVRDVHIIWNIHDGYDWQHTRDGISDAVEHVEAQLEERRTRHRRSLSDPTEEDPVIADFLFNSIYIGVSPNNDAQNLRRQINKDIDDLVSETESASVSGASRLTSTTSRTGRVGRPLSRKRRLKLERSKTHKVAFELRGLSADVSVFPPDSGDVVQSIDVRVRNFEIFDNVPTSTWRKFLTHMDVAREMAKPMVHLEIDNIRTLKDFAAAELTIHATLLPLRLHVDQDALDFITRFFAFKDPRISTEPNPNEQPFLQRVEVDTVDLRLDYKPKRIDYVGLRSGHTTEFMNFITLEGTNIRLKHAIVYGLRGFEPLHKTLNDVWMPDVRANQLPTVLAGLAPVRGIVNIGSGVRDVIAIPIQEYRKDGRIVRSIRKGALQFGKTTASELARLGAKVAVGTQNILQGAEDLLTPASASDAHGYRRGGGPRGTWPSSEPGHHDDVDDGSDDGERRLISAYAEQPLGVLSGLQSARRRLEYDLVTARDALIAVQGEILESSSPAAVAAAVARHAPTVILRPVIGASRAVSTTLMGVGNQIDRDNARRMEDKYKRR